MNAFRAFLWMGIVSGGLLPICLSAEAQNAASAAGVTVAGAIPAEAPLAAKETDAERVLRIKKLKQLRARNEPKGNAGSAFGSARLYNTNPQTLPTGMVSKGQTQSATPEKRSVPIVGR